ncbi:type II toxin-antitoxin system RelE/ParE family toxin [Methylocystis suflitae]|uniref:type II toxin-antitoxin system RelE/ParE family toxin n=1 Tax=Methylocystis suflitae TaxID=2951405 RepID=UPI00210E0F49|nr:type II toxin-antitoxin system RelE/ParE family toxin [Methylocystis suflitae]MCQ4191704.1 type II toxin-antitoxin system RelE/ParE family toxin [Methylocystis suflitae]
MRVRWTTPALRDLEVIGDHIERDNSAAVAARVVMTILDQADNLAEFPHMGRPGRIPNTRELVVVDTPFIVPYRVRDAEVEILAVVHGARQWPDKFD